MNETEFIEFDCFCIFLVGGEGGRILLLSHTSRDLDPPWPLVSISVVLFLGPTLSFIFVLLHYFFPFLMQSNHSFG